MIRTVGIGILGCGNISDIYLKNLSTVFHNVRVLGVCDINDAAAEDKTEQYHLEKRYHSYDEMLADPEVEVILDICPPLLHYELNKKALLAGKHVYSEKPLAVEYAEAAELAELAERKGLMIGCSPDTVLGAAIQTCRKIVESGMIGDVVGCSANLIKRGVETWHPNPNFLYQRGAGPLLDMGPYYIGTMLQIIGGVRAVQGMCGISFKERVITSQPHYGEIIHVNVPTYVNALLEFESGAMGSLTMTFDVYKAHLPFVEIYGSKGSLSVPDPNCFGAEPILLFRPEKDKWYEMPFMYGYAENSRGLGLSDLCRAIACGGKPRAGAEAAVHTVEIIQAINESAQTGTRVPIRSRYSKPEMMDGEIN